MRIGKTRIHPISLSLIVLAALALYWLIPVPVKIDQFILAILPIATVLGCMIGLHWGAQKAGPAGWAVGIVIAMLSFGLTIDVLWVSQLKGLLLSLFVLAVLWPALLLYNLVDQMGGIRAIALALEKLISDRGLLLIVVAWSFSGMLEGLAGFGLPVAIVSPMLVSLGVSPVRAVAAVAIGHAWSVTFGDMGVIYQTLVGLVDVNEPQLIATASLLLGAAVLGCGLATAQILGYRKRWPAVVFLALVISVAQYVIATIGLISLAAFGAGLAGILGGVILDRVFFQRSDQNGATSASTSPAASETSLSQAQFKPSILRGAILSYAGLTTLMVIITLIKPVNDALKTIVWRISFPEVITRAGVVTPAGFGQIFRPLLHPGTLIMVVVLLTYFGFRQTGLMQRGSWRQVTGATRHSAIPASVGVIAMVGLATLMEHTGMTYLLADVLSDTMGRGFPMASPLVGILGAFATGSNNNSNVLFASLQYNASQLLLIAPYILLAAQTTGGALGSMIAPAKIVVGCSSTPGAQGRDGEVLRTTLPYAFAIGLGIGLLTLVLAYY